MGYIEEKEDFSYGFHGFPQIIKTKIRLIRKLLKPPTPLQ